MLRSILTHFTSRPSSAYPLDTILKKWVQWTILSFTFASSFAFADESKLLIEKLNQMPTLRIAAITAIGNGDQAMAINLIKRLRQLGLTSHIELYFDAPIKKKLEFLLPPFRADGEDHQFIESLDVRTFPLKERSETRVPFAIVATDYVMSLRDLNAERVVEINTPLWIGNSPRAYDRTSHQSFKSIARTTPMRVPAIEVADVKKFLEEQMGHSDHLKPKIDGLTALLQARAANQIDLISAYGFGFEGFSPLSRLIQGATISQNFATAPKPLVIAMISNLQEWEWQRTFESLKTAGFDRPALYEITSPILADDLSSAKPHDVIIVKVGNVAQEVWNLLMRASNLPPVASGANGLNFLFQLGKPFMSTRPNSLYFHESEAFDVSHLKGTTLALTEALMVNSAESPSTIASFITQARSPDSKLSQEFKKYSEFLATQPDRVCAALLETEKVFPNFGIETPATVDVDREIQLLVDGLRGK